MEALQAGFLAGRILKRNKEQQVGISRNFWGALLPDSV